MFAMYSPKHVWKICRGLEISVNFSQLSIAVWKEYEVFDPLDREAIHKKLHDSPQELNTEHNFSPTTSNILPIE